MYARPSPENLARVREKVPELVGDLTDDELLYTKDAARGTSVKKTKTVQSAHAGYPASDIARALHQYAEKHNLRFGTEVAQKLGVPYSTFCGWWSGTVVPSPASQELLRLKLDGLLPDYRSGAAPARESGSVVPGADVAPVDTHPQAEQRRIAAEQTSPDTPMARIRLEIELERPLREGPGELYTFLRGQDSQRVTVESVAERVVVTPQNSTPTPRSAAKRKAQNNNAKSKANEQ